MNARARVWFRVTVNSWPRARLGLLLGLCLWLGLGLSLGLVLVLGLG